MRFECTSLQRHVTRRYADYGPLRTEVVTVTLVPEAARDPMHPNRATWADGIGAGHLVLAELQPATAALFELHRRYWVDVHAVADDEGGSG